MNVCNFTLYLLCWVFILVTVILCGYALARSDIASQARSYPVPACYNDWKCWGYDSQQGRVEINMSDKVVYGVMSATQVCTPITSDNICSFKYIDSNGQEQTGVPGNEVNTWSQDPNYPDCGIIIQENGGECPERDYSACPNYKVGDIYWKACYYSLTKKCYTERNYANPISDNEPQCPS